MVRALGSETMFKKLPLGKSQITGYYSECGHGAACLNGLVIKSCLQKGAALIFLEVTEIFVIEVAKWHD